MCSFRIDFHDIVVGNQLLHIVDKQHRQTAFRPGENDFRRFQRQLVLYENQCLIGYAVGIDQAVRTGNSFIREKIG